MKKFYMFFMLAFVLVLGACGNGDDDADTTDDAEDDADTEEVVEDEEAAEDEDEEATEEEDEEADDEEASTSDFDAEEYARTNCAACHGQDFTGGMGPDLNGLDEATITDAVREGPGSMPSYSEDQISDEELEVLAGYFSGL